MNKYIKIQIALAVICSIYSIGAIIAGSVKGGIFLLAINIITIAISIHGHWQMQQWKKSNKKTK
jgi:hypothetical protein